MSLKYYVPFNASIRFCKTINKFFLWKGSNFSFLKFGKTVSAGKNIHGHITALHRGGRVKALSVLTFQNILSLDGVIIRSEYSARRSSFLSLFYTFNGWFFFLLKARGVRVGDILLSTYYTIGSFQTLKKVQKGSHIFNLNSLTYRIGFFTRAAGCSSLFISDMLKYALIKLSSGKRVLLSTSLIVNLGKVSNSLHRKIVFGKAGKSRLLGIRPTVRGLAMNPIDHPHGGGSGKGRHPVSLWGKLTKGKKTLHLKKLSLLLN